jgi:hypothetical protein
MVAMGSISDRSSWAMAGSDWSSRWNMPSALAKRAHLMMILSLTSIQSEVVMFCPSLIWAGLIWKERAIGGSMSAV